MTKRAFIYLCSLVTVALILAAWISMSPSRRVPQANSAAWMQAHAPPAAYSSHVPDPGGPLSLKTMSRKEATRIYVQRGNQDHEYDWKVPLNFYGKVLDENSQPVAGATARMQWNTIGVPGGTSSEQTVSDSGGFFSLTGQHGKLLEVRVEKDGYYTVDGGAGGLAFEYANPWSSNYIEPDANQPVIFHLRKRGEGIRLFSKILRIPLSLGHSLGRIDLMKGFIKPDGVLTITTDKSHFLPGNQPFPWTMSLSMNEGGMTETNDQFPFLAPANGYTPSITYDMTNTDRSIWQDGVSKTYYFYLPSTNTYGRMTVTTLSSLPFVTLDYKYNPISGNRILEATSK